MPDANDPVLKRPRRAAPEVRQAAILDAALAEFARHGFADARVEDIARGAAVSKGTVYLYYPTKQALFEALVRRDIGPRVAMIARFLDGHDGPLEPVLHQLMGVLAGMIETGAVPIYPRLLIAEAARFPELVAFYRREVIGVVLGALGGVFERAMKRGEIAHEDPVMLAHLFVAPGLKAVLWSLVFTPVEAEPLPPRAYLETHVRLFLKGLKHA
jgi:AcrR family transcriptional regulator